MSHSGVLSVQGSLGFVYLIDLWRNFSSCLKGSPAPAHLLLLPGLEAQYSNISSNRVPICTFNLYRCFVHTILMSTPHYFFHRSSLHVSLLLCEAHLYTIALFRWSLAPLKLRLPIFRSPIVRREQVYYMLPHCFLSSSCAFIVSLSSFNHQICSSHSAIGSSITASELVTWSEVWRTGAPPALWPVTCWSFWSDVGLLFSLQCSQCAGVCRSLLWAWFN